MEDRTVERLLDALEMSVRAARRLDNQRAADVILDHIRAVKDLLARGEDRLAEYLNRLEKGMEVIA